MQCTRASGGDCSTCIAACPHGTLVIESSEDPEAVWTRIPPKIREEIIAKDIKVYSLPGFEIAHNATDRRDLQVRMQGNAFLGAFFAVSTLLEDNNITREHFEQVVRQQYDSKFGKFGAAVVESNMKVMTDGFERVQAIPHGAVDAPDRSEMRGESILPVNGSIPRWSASGCGAATP